MLGHVNVVKISKWGNMGRRMKNGGGNFWKAKEVKMKNKRMNLKY